MANGGRHFPNLRVRVDSPWGYQNVKIEREKKRPWAWVGVGVGVGGEHGVAGKS
jgi:hypothetical protein